MWSSLQVLQILEKQEKESTKWTDKLGNELEGTDYYNVYSPQHDI